MLLVREVFHAKFGRGDELVALFQEFNRRVQDAEGSGALYRILTDVSGIFFTVIAETEAASLAAWETSFQEEMSRPWMDDWFARMVPLVESGSRQFYTIVA